MPTSAADRWAAAAAASAQTPTAFHTFSWLMCAARSTGTRFVPLVLVEGDTDIGVVPLLLRRRGPAVLVNWVPFPYLGPLVPASRMADCLELLRRQLSHRLVMLQQQAFAPAAHAATDPFLAAGFDVSTDQTFVVDLGPSEGSLWDALDGGCRRRVRKALRDGVVVTGPTDGTDLPAVVDAMFASRGIRSGYRPRLAIPASNEEIEVRDVIARADGEVVGAMVSMIHDGRALIWQGGVLPSRRATNAAPLLYWDAISWARRCGARSIDLVGVPDEGIRRFKSQFGGRLTPYLVAQRSSRLMSLRTRLARSAPVGPEVDRPSPVPSRGSRPAMEVL